MYTYIHAYIFAGAVSDARVTPSGTGGGALAPAGQTHQRSCTKREIDQNVYGNEVCYTNLLILLVLHAAPADMATQSPMHASPPLGGMTSAAPEEHWHPQVRTLLRD